ncbi:MAG TPA: energy transducer TonB [Bacteroidia bacterium]|nr:energy transducer TonB [Bacteroidia bacterium]
MKKSLTLLSLIALVSLASAQNPKFYFEAKKQKTIQHEELDKARNLSDLMPDFPVLWITEIQQTELESAYEGKSILATGTGSLLSAEQKKLLQATALNSELKLKVKYTYKNPVNGNPEAQTMKYNTEVVPFKPAEFTGGYEKLNEVMSKAMNGALSDPYSHEKFKQVKASLYINEKGEVEDCSIIKSSGSAKIDQLFLDTIKAMPTWKAAEDAKGNKVKERFEFSFNAMAAGGC